MGKRQIVEPLNMDFEDVVERVAKHTPERYEGEVEPVLNDGEGGVLDVNQKNQRERADIDEGKEIISNFTKPLTFSKCCPLLKWPGGKTSELQEIQPRIPKHKRYFEPFFGGGAVYFNTINTQAFVNDSHCELMLFYKMIKKQDTDFFALLNDFIEVWNKRSITRKEIYLQIRDRYNQNQSSDIEKALDFFILREYAYAGMFRVNSSGKFNVPFGAAYVNKNIQKKIDYLKSDAVIAKMNKLNISNNDFKYFLNEFSFNENDFMFVDPPYNCSFTKYGEEDFSLKDQDRLRDYLISFKGKFMLVTQYTDYIRKLYEPYNLYTYIYDKKYRFNIKGRFNRNAKHALITNYVPNI